MVLGVKRLVGLHGLWTQGMGLEAEATGALLGPMGGS